VPVSNREGIAHGDSVLRLQPPSTERRFRYFQKYFDRAAPWTFAIQNRTPHCCRQNAQKLIPEWLSDVLATMSARMRGGQFGYLTVQETDITVWNHHTFKAATAE
jgi:hypothetical protein